MNTVYKYELAVNDEVQRFALMYEGADINLCGAQEGRICLWMQVDTDRQHQRRAFRVIGTGHPIPEGAQWVGSTQMPPFVWHVYEVSEP